MPAIKVCLQNAEKLIAASKASAVPGSYHIAFHLATMALEEIGKCSMIFIDAIDHKAVGGDEETKTPLKRIDDHERKHFGQVTQTSCSLPTQVVNGKECYDSRKVDTGRKKLWRPIARLNHRLGARETRMFHIPQSRFLPGTISCTANWIARSGLFQT